MIGLIAGIAVVVAAPSRSLEFAAGGGISKGPHPVIIDTDMDTDDILAISYLLQQMNRHVINIEAIVVTSSGFSDQWAGVDGAMRLTQFFEQPHIPVAFAPRTNQGRTGAAEGAPESWRRGIDGFLQDTNIREQYMPLDFNPRPAHHSAVHLYRSVLERNGPRGTNILVLGPFDAVRDTFEVLGDDMAAKTRTLYVSGGSFAAYLNPTVVLEDIANETTRNTKAYKEAYAKADASEPQTLAAQEVVVEYARKNLPQGGWPPADGGKTPGSAWNIFADPLSAQAFLQWGDFKDVVMMTDNATHQLFVNVNDSWYIPDESENMHCPSKYRNFSEEIYKRQAQPSHQPLTSIRYWDEGAASLMIKDLQPDAFDGKLCTAKISHKKLLVDMYYGGSYAWTEITDEEYGSDFREACTSADNHVFKKDFFSVLAGCAPP